MPPCPDAERLAAGREGRLAGLEAHLLACPDCREALRCLSEGEAPPLPAPILERLRALKPPRRVSWIPAAAAAVLLAAGILAWRSPRADPPAPVTVSRLPIPDGSDVLVSRGGRLDPIGPSRLKLSAGVAWIDTPEPLTLEIPGGTLEVGSGRWAVEIPPSPRTAWIASALAEEGVPRIWGLEGQARLVLGKEPRLLRAPLRLDLGGKEAPLSVSDAEALEARRLQALLDLPPLPEAGALPATYRWTLRISEREGSAELALTLPAAGAWRRWTVGLAGERPRAAQTVDILWDGACLVARVDGKRVLSLDAAGVARLLPAAVSPGWQAQVLGGRATLRQSRSAR